MLADVEGLKLPVLLGVGAEIPGVYLVLAEHEPLYVPDARRLLMPSLQLLDLRVAVLELLVSRVSRLQLPPAVTRRPLIHPLRLGLHTRLHLREANPPVQALVQPFEVHVALRVPNLHDDRGLYVNC